MLLPGLAARREPATGPPQRRATQPASSRACSGRRAVAAGQRVEVAAGQLVLRGGPLARARVVRVLQPAVRVGDGAAVQVVDEVQALGAGVGGSGRSRATRVVHPRVGTASRRRDRTCERRIWGTCAGAGSRPAAGRAAGAPTTVRTGTTPAHRPPAATSSSSSTGGPVAHLDARLGEVQRERRRWRRAPCGSGSGRGPTSRAATCSVTARSAGQALGGVGDEPGPAVHHRAAVVHRVVEHRARVDHAVDVGHRHADRRARRRPRAGCRRRWSRAGRACRRSRP